MNQLTFKFPFKTNFFEEDFYVSTNNFEAYKLIKSWPKWSGRFVNIFGPSGCGKTHLANIFNKKINSLFVKASDLNNNLLFDAWFLQPLHFYPYNQANVVIHAP